MILKVIATGSTGNCYKLESSTGHQLMIEAGIKYEKIAPEFNFNKLDGVVISHLAHADHSLSKNKLEMCGVDVYSHENLQNGVPKNIGDEWIVMPCSVPHGRVECFSYIIRNKIDNKKILFCTDLERFPNIGNTHFDCMMLECNFSEVIVNSMSQRGIEFNNGCFTHMSLESLRRWLEPRSSKPDNIVLIHSSNSGLINLNVSRETISKFAKNVFIGKPKLKINI